MFYLGCLPLLFLILVVAVIAMIRGFIRNVCDVLYGLWLTVRDWWFGLFRPTPTISEIEDVYYYRATSERPKYYSPDDGEYVKFKKVK